MALREASRFDYRKLRGLLETVKDESKDITTLIKEFTEEIEKCLTQLNGLNLKSQDYQVSLDRCRGAERMLVRVYETTIVFRKNTVKRILAFELKDITNLELQEARLYSHMYKIEQTLRTIKQKMNEASAEKLQLKKKLFLASPHGPQPQSRAPPTSPEARAISHLSPKPKTSEFSSLLPSRLEFSLPFAIKHFPLPFYHTATRGDENSPGNIRKAKNSSGRGRRSPGGGVGRGPSGGVGRSLGGGGGRSSGGGGRRPGGGGGRSAGGGGGRSLGVGGGRSLGSGGGRSPVGWGGRSPGGGGVEMFSYLSPAGKLAKSVGLRRRSDICTLKGRKAVKVLPRVFTKSPKKRRNWKSPKKRSQSKPVRKWPDPMGEVAREKANPLAPDSASPKADAKADMPEKPVQPPPPPRRRSVVTHREIKKATLKGNLHELLAPITNTVPPPPPPRKKEKKLPTSLPQQKRVIRQKKGVTKGGSTGVLTKGGGTEGGGTEGGPEGGSWTPEVGEVRRRRDEGVFFRKGGCVDGNGKLHNSPRFPLRTSGGILKIYFENFANSTFRKVRKIAGRNEKSFWKELSDGLEPFSTNSKSGASFFLTKSKTSVVKCVSAGEWKFLASKIHLYSKHVLTAKNTLLARILAMFTIKIDSDPRYIIVVESVWPSDVFIHLIYDLKGSEAGRSATERDFKRRPNHHQTQIVLKDNDWKASDRKLHLRNAKESTEKILDRVKADVEFLTSIGVLDYSLLVGIHLPTSQFWEKEMVRKTSPARATLVSADEKEVYYLGIIDFLVFYGLKKRGEYYFRQVQGLGSRASVLPPKWYGQRFIEFTKSMFYCPDPTSAATTAMAPTSKPEISDIDTKKEIRVETNA
ncbi:hypothetical protein AAMO2058_001339100 [Amorphochlora amoebiformis]